MFLKLHHPALTSLILLICVPLSVYGGANELDVDHLRVLVKGCTLQHETELKEYVYDLRKREERFQALEVIAEMGNDIAIRHVAWPLLKEMAAARKEERMQDVALSFLPRPKWLYFEVEVIDFVAGFDNDKAEEWTVEAYQKWLGSDMERRRPFVELILRHHWHGWLTILKAKTKPEVPPKQVSNAMMWAMCGPAVNDDELTDWAGILRRLLDDNRDVPNSVAPPSGQALEAALSNFPLLRSEMALRQLTERAPLTRRLAFVRQWLEKHGGDIDMLKGRRTMREYMTSLQEHPLPECATVLEAWFGVDFFLYSVSRRRDRKSVV